MSKYTTEVRFICEDYAGLDESKGGSSVADIIENSRAKIFNFPFPIFDEEYRPVIETKILKHFYTREIGFETVGLWQLKLDTKLNEIMPYYNKFYESALLEFNPLYTKDLTRKKDVEITTEDNLTGSQENEKEVSASGSESNNTIQTVGTTNSETVTESKNAIGNESGTAGSDTVNRDLYSDTPQGALTGVENETYLTNARKITNNTDNEYDIDRTNSEANTIGKSGTGSENNSISNSINKTSENSETNNSSITQNKDGNSVEDYLERVYGYESGSASKLLKEYRETFINIDLMVINELEELFMQLW